MDEADKRVIRALQEDFPLVAEPYKELAKVADMTEAEFLRRVLKLKETGAIRKMGAVLKHRNVGFTSNVLCAWEISEDKADEVAKSMSEERQVSHCYIRKTAPGWDYNLYTMIHGKSREDCENTARRLQEANGVTKPPAMLFTVKEWKKTGMKYFLE